MRKLIAAGFLMLAWMPLASLHAAPATLAPDEAHYDFDAKIDAAGRLSAKVAVELASMPETRSITFIMGSRFELSMMDVGADTKVTLGRVDKPVKGLQTITLDFAPAAAPPPLRFVYAGPLDSGSERGAKPYTPELIELVLDHMWFPTRNDIGLRFTADARIEGVPEDLVVVAQGEFSHDGNTVRIQRDTVDVDLPMVAARGLRRDTAPGVEFFAANDSVLVALFRKHAALAADYLQDWFGPLKQPIRMAVVSRDRGSAYARAAYTVVSDGGEVGREAEKKDFPEANPARHVAHEFAHAWWSPADPVGEHYWLSESMAQYASLRYVEHVLGAAESEKIVDMLRKPGLNAGAIMGHGRPTGAQLYQRGPLLLFKLEKTIGRPALDRVLATLGRKPPRTTQEFLDVLSAEAGAKVADDFNALLYSSATRL